MNPIFINALALFFCWVYLISCIIFDCLDNPTIDIPYDPGCANPLIYYIPLFLMIDALIFSCYQNFKGFSKWIDVQWFMFILFSANQTAKNIFPFMQPDKKSILDYITFGIIIAYTIYNLTKNPKH